MEVLVRSYCPTDATATAEAFQVAIRTTAAEHYSPEQIDAWAGDQIDLDAWNRRRLDAWTVVAELDHHVVGFSDLTAAGELDMLFVHPRAGGRGVARLLVSAVLAEAHARGLSAVRTHASRAARPVFERMGFWLENERTDNMIRGVRVPNYDMRSPNLEDMETAAATGHGELPEGTVTIPGWGGMPEGHYAFPGTLRDRLVAAILAGDKTATASLLVSYEREDAPLPGVGDLEAVVDSHGQPVCVTRNTEVRVVRLAEVTDDHAWREGEGYADAAAWRRGHERFWTSSPFLEELGEPRFELTDDTLVVCVRFAVVDRLGLLT